MEIVNFSAQTDQGPFLNINEDSYDFSFDNELYMVFDGFGGNGVGDVCVNHLKRSIKSFYKNFVRDRDATLPFYFSPKFLIEGNALINAALLSHHELYKKNLEKEVSHRAGASAILAVRSESILSVLSTGNCRAYMIRKGNIRPLINEDSFYFLSHDKYESHLKNIPLSGFGLFPDLHYQLKEVRISAGDKIIFMTDGVYGRVDEQEIYSSIGKETLNIKLKIKELFELSNQRGNLDNQTCMIMEF
ncbi:MAG: PP2C family protein-serine/threonine phosphatase [Bacteriovoracaceae bacterium]|jgi:serine/threonine protein phosphatase PrpC|nr:hypothetical protein [Halobacteriovoraceae bacterium]MDP7321698.1 PP2C family protein-serine/threonine phosphatase [Bacteriovoracaceae bacterium]|tara:strand:+ start:646 stop:1383 length:738 start_codon:yes stop_codon:yes gene_type:complete